MRPKVNRWLPWFAGAVLAAGIIAFLIAYFSNTAGSNSNARLSNKPAQTVAPAKNVPFPPAAKRVAAEFIDAGVRGNNPVRAYQLSGPGIRGEYHSLKQWLRDWRNPNVGVPIAPYPAAQGAQLHIDYSTTDEVQVKFFLMPRAGVHQKPQTFLMVLDRVGRGPRAHWIVNSWQTYEPPAIPSPQ